MFSSRTHLHIPQHVVTHTTQEYQNEATSKREKDAELKMMPEISWKTASLLDRKKNVWIVKKKIERDAHIKP